MRNVKFRCPEELYERLERKKVTRGCTLQQLCVEALALFLDEDTRPRASREEWLAALKSIGEKHPGQIANIPEFLEISLQVMHGVSKWMEEHPDQVSKMLESNNLWFVKVDSFEEFEWMLLWQTFGRTMPTSSKQPVKQLLFELLDLFNSSRRKPSSVEARDGNEEK